MALFSHVSTATPTCLSRSRRASAFNFINLMSEKSHKFPDPDQIKSRKINQMNIAMRLNAVRSFTIPLLYAGCAGPPPSWSPAQHCCAQMSPVSCIPPESENKIRRRKLFSSDVEATSPFRSTKAPLGQMSGPRLSFRRRHQHLQSHLHQRVGGSTILATALPSTRTQHQGTQLHHCQPCVQMYWTMSSSSVSGFKSSFV